jgi:hypothetical protein
VGVPSETNGVSVGVGVSTIGVAVAVLVGVGVSTVGVEVGVPVSVGVGLLVKVGVTGGVLVGGI